MYYFVYFEHYATNMFTNPTTEADKDSSSTLQIISYLAIAYMVMLSYCISFYQLADDSRESLGRQIGMGHKF